MIEVNSLSKRFGSLWALKQTTWSVEPGRALGLLGPNGAGKSTTMKIITGLLCASEGRVSINGHDVLHNPLEAKRQLGYLPEVPPLHEELKVIDFLYFVCGLKSILRSQQARQVEKVIDQLKLTEVAYRPIAKISKGFRQRVGIAQALLGEPALLILDEPSVGLDPHQVFELREIIKNLKGKHTLVLSTHVLSEVQQVCDDVVILHHGEVRAQGPLKKLLQEGKDLEKLFIEVTQ